jgi:hypothetical protein
VGNYCSDSGTSINPSANSGSASGYIRVLIDLTTNQVQKNIQPPITWSRSISGGVLRSETYDWSGLQAYSATDRLVNSGIYNNVTTYSSSAPFVTFTGSSDMRTLYKTSRACNIGVGERVLQTDGLIAYFAIYVSTDQGETLLNASAGENTNRFVYTATTSLGSGMRFFDILDSGLNFVEASSPGSIGSFVPPVPSTTLYQIERKTSPQQVTVQKLGFDFTVQGSVQVSVYPPDINQGATSNYGTVLAASYAESQT